MKEATMTRQANSDKIVKLVELALLTGLTVLLALTPLGYLPIGTMIKISFLMIPVVIGAMVIGPAAGAFLGTVFGITSFMTCVTSTDFFGALTFSISPIGAFMVTIPTRALAGFVPGLICKGLKGKLKGVILYPLCAVIGSLCNTIFTLAMLFLFYGTNAEVASVLGGDVFAYVVATILSLNAVLEAVACGIIGAGLSGVINRFSHK